MGWLLAAANRLENVEPGLVIEMIHNWNDGKNEIFDFQPNSRKASKFKESKREQWIQQLPKFGSADPNNSNNNLSFSLFKYSLLGLVLRIILRAVNAQDVGTLLCKWATTYQDATHLISVECWDD